MNNFFWGFFLIYIHFNLNLGSHTFELLPDFLGYMRIRDGAGELEAESSRFRDCRAVSRVLVIYSLILWIVKALGGPISGSMALLASLAEMIGRLYVGWAAISGIREMEVNRGLDLNGQKLYGSWVAMAATQAVSTVLAMLGVDEGGLHLLLIVMWFIAMILFLRNLWTAKKGYEAVTG